MVASAPCTVEESIVSTRQDLAWWQKLLVTLKLWRPTYVTKHTRLRDLPAPVPPPVTGAYGNRVDSTKRRRLVPQSSDRA